MTIQERNVRIKELKQQIVEVTRPLQIELSTLLNECPHEIAIPIDFFKKLAKDRWHSASAHCLGCGKYFGWFCPKSPDHICKYAEDDPCCDHCLFCGMPEERK